MSFSDRFSFARLWAMIVKEFIQMARDRLTFAMILGIPLIQLTVYGYVINTDPRHIHRRFILAQIPHEAVHAPRIRPVGLNRHGMETQFRNQPLRDLGPDGIKFVRAVRGLADKNDPGISASFNHGVVVGGSACEWLGGISNSLDFVVHAVSIG